jgi:hypothetical protein
VAFTRGNPNWCSRYGSPPGRADFIREDVKGLSLSPEQYVDSEALKDWTRKNKNQKYIPSALLAVWGFTVDVGH